MLNYYFGVKDKKQVAEMVRDCRTLRHSDMRRRDISVLVQDLQKISVQT